MILVDSNIIIDFWRNPTEKTKDVFLNQRIYICGVVKAEILHGAKDEANFKKIDKALNCFPSTKTQNTFWDDLSQNLFILKKHGKTVPFQDAMIATLAISNSLQLWTNDKHFFHIQEVLSSLVLFDIKD